MPEPSPVDLECEFVLRDSLFAAALCGRAVKEPLGPLKFCRRHREQVLEALIDCFATNERLLALINKRANRDDHQALRDQAWTEVIEAIQTRERELQNQRRPVIYFVQRDNLVKIGTTINLEKRIKEIDRGSSAISGMPVTPVKLLACFPGGREKERQLHRRFAALHVDGEWFQLEGDLRRYIARLQAGTDLPACS